MSKMPPAGEHHGHVVPVGDLDDLLVTNGPTRLRSSAGEGRRQPFWPPTALLAQVVRATFHVTVVVCGDFSHTSPVVLSRTASLLKADKRTNRCAAGRALSQFWMTPASNSSFTGGAVAGVPPSL